MGEKNFFIEKNEFLSSIVDKKMGEKYDVAIMYSGGKDSSFLIYLLKEVYKKRVIAVTVDNGFEKPEQWDAVMDFPKKMGVDHIILKPDSNGFRHFFKSAVLEKDLYYKDGTNHICFICNNFLWLLVCKYALNNKIPYVASGLSLEQLSSGRKEPLKPTVISNSIAAKSTQFISFNAIKSVKNSDEYKKNNDFRNFIDEISVNTSEVTTIYPFIYHELSVNNLKNKIVEYGWRPPRNVSIDKYISSGCKIMSVVIPQLEKLGLVIINEREQNKKMVEKGLIDAQFSDYSKGPKDNSIDLSDSLFDDLGIKEFLENYKKDN